MTSRAVARRASNHDVAVCHHADQLVVLSNRNGAYVVLAHQFGNLGDGRFRANPIDALVHHFFDFHGGASIVVVCLHS
jgi:hypothetical protein